MDNAFLLNHALKNIWSSPYQDLQAVFKPHRMTDAFGTKGYLQLAWDTFYLPNQEDTFHVYQIGRLHPALIGLFPVRTIWTSATSQCNLQGMIIDVYDERGLKVPLFDVFFKVLSNENLIIAIRNQPKVIDLATASISLRFYSNAYFESPMQVLPRLDQSYYDRVLDGGVVFRDDIRSNIHPGDILVKGIRVRSRNEVQALNALVTELRGVGFGDVLCYYNGEIVPDFSGYYFNVNRVQRDDWAEIVFDASIRKIQYFDIATLPTFQSIKDGGNKYILQYDEPWTGEVMFKDDYDLFLIAPVGNDRHHGRYYYRNVPSAVRMITHQDYAIPTTTVTQYEDQATGFVDPYSWKVMMVFRYSSYNQKTLINEAARLDEFFKMDMSDRLRALQGIDSTVPFWRADYLENSDLSVLFGERPFRFTTEQVEDALGYHGIVSILNPGMIPTFGSAVTDHRWANLPAGLQLLSTVFEYDGNGGLLGWKVVRGTERYSCDSSECRYIEGFAGEGGKIQNTLFGNGPHQTDTDWDYAFYKRQRVGGVPTGPWMVADPSDYRVDENAVAWWNISEVDWQLVIRCNREFLLYEIDVDARDGLSVFSIQSVEEDPEEPFNRVELLPFGRLDIYFNGKPLIYGIDYNGEWPQYVVTNHDYIAPGGLQRIVIRAGGHPKNDNGTPVLCKPVEVDFVRYGKLSRNGKYDSRVGRNQRYTVRGKILSRDQLNFSETGITVTPSPAVSGDPYSIENVVVPMGNFTTKGTYELREIALERNEIVEAYMSRYYEEEVQPLPDLIPERYRLVSPLMTKLIHDMKHGLLHVPPSIAPLTQAKLELLIEDYLYLVDYDPVTLGLDWQYAQVVPHGDRGMIILGVYEYQVLSLVNRIYLNDMLDLSKYVGIDPAWQPQPLPPL